MRQELEEERRRDVVRQISDTYIKKRQRRLQNVALDQFEAMLPRERITVTIDVLGENTRRFCFSGTTKYALAIKQLLLDCADLQL